MLGKTYRVAWIVAALLLANGVAYGQVARLSGKVIGEDGQPVQGAIVKVKRQAMSGGGKVKTNKRGEYVFAFLRLGVYNVTLEINGEEVSRVINIKLLSFGEPRKLDFDLGKIKRDRATAQSGDLTSSQLKNMTSAQREAYQASLKKRRVQLSKSKALNDAFNAAMEAAQLKNYPLAIAEFKKAAVADATQVAVWAQYAKIQAAFAETKRGDEAKQLRTGSIDSYRKALAIDPSHAAFRNNLALELIKNGDLDEGKVELEKAATLDPANGGKYYFNLGAVMVNRGNVLAAVDAFRKATEISPNYGRAYYQLGIALMSSAEMDENGVLKPVPGTIEAFEKYIEVEPQGPYAVGAQAMIQTLSTAVATSYTNPDAKKRERRKRRKK
jgi:tetratricopeptide (TPR) repeat protein